MSLQLSASSKGRKFRVLKAKYRIFALKVSESKHSPRKVGLSTILMYSRALQVPHLSRGALFWFQRAAKRRTENLSLFFLSLDSKISRLNLFNPRF